jgi:electron transport complex protein RnfG
MSASPQRLIGTLTVAGALAGVLLVSVYGWAAPRIARHQEAALDAAVREVLAAPARYQTLWIVGDAVVDELPAGTDSAAAERVFLGFDAQDRPVGWAILGAQPGFADVVRLIFGYDAASNTLLGMRVVENRETPGLGDRIVKDSAFVAGFDGAATPLVGVKAGAGTGADVEVDMITGATISSRVVIAIINERIAALDPLLDAYVASARSPGSRTPDAGRR